MLSDCCWWRRWCIGLGTSHSVSSLSLFCVAYQISFPRYSFLLYTSLRYWDLTGYTRFGPSATFVTHLAVLIFLELNLKDVLDVSLTGKKPLKSWPMTSFNCGWTQVLAKIGYFYLSLVGNFISWNNHFPFSMFVIGVPFSSLLKTVLKGSII